MKQKSKKKPVKDSNLFEQAVGLYEKALKLFHKKDYDGARKLLKQVTDDFGGELDICDRARVYLRIIEDQAHSTPRVKEFEDLYLLGQLEHNAGDYSSALKRFEQALGLAPKDNRLHLLIAATHARAERPEEAIDALREAIKRDPDNRYLAQRDPDFEPLEDHPDYQSLVGEEQQAAAAGS